MTDRHFLLAEVRLASLEEGDTVLEVGSGDGRLTELIAERAGKVIAVELDDSLAAHLSKTAPENVKVLNQDILTVDLPHFNKVMGNVPYSISSPLIFRLLEHDFELGVLAFQYEFALRLCARPGSSDYSRISAMLGLMTTKVKLALKIPRKAFYPVPNVDSAAVLLYPDPDADLPDETCREIIRMLFCHKKKKVKNAIEDSERDLRKTFGITPDMVLNALEVDLEGRVFQMGPQELRSACRSLEEIL